ncbi:hypothetical protein ARMGADRAFT_927676 [Armillaria gallica]|uniref:Uncharacterized protein n=1 Tax=Armillaria gallica TaxID=47427 RepID=A0A2H3DSF8_ARMGA|nr:hypothetical protein ARMGADRAFT_927676 [Armillaria gallica]
MSKVTSSSLESIIPQGCHWYNYSCAYDAIVFILYNIWASDIDYFSIKFRELNSEWLGLMSDSFKKHINKQYSLEQIQDYICHRLCNVYPDHFKFGANASVEDVFSKIFTGSTVFNKVYCTCSNGHQTHIIESYNCSFYLGGTGELQWTTIQDFFNICNNRPVSQKCNVCGCNMKKIDMLMYAPGMIAVVVSWTAIPADHTLHININENATQYILCGIIYFRENHFTAQYIDNTQTVWFNDGIELVEGPFQRVISLILT